MAKFYLRRAPKKLDPSLLLCSLIMFDTSDLPQRLKSFDKSGDDDEITLTDAQKESLAEGGFYYREDRPGEAQCFACEASQSLADERFLTDPAGVHRLEAPACTATLDEQLQYAPKHPDYADPHSRLTSYDGWSEQAVSQGTGTDVSHTPLELAAAGFYYAGKDDVTVCYDCGMRCRDWSPGEDAWKKHAVLSRRCRYVRACRGDAFVDALVANSRINARRRVCACENPGRQTCFDPCGHIISCTECVLTYENCVICTMRIRQRLPLFYG